MAGQKRTDERAAMRLAEVDKTLHRVEDRVAALVGRRLSVAVVEHFGVRLGSTVSTGTIGYRCLKPPSGVRCRARH
jgi:hypothetical protein